LFIDKARILASGGHGGNGCLSFRREKYIEMGGPDGGSGGRGGSVWLEADPEKATLADFSYRPHFKGESGVHGKSADRTGRSGDDLVVKVPAGTLVFQDGRLVADLVKAGDRFLAARGGRGGRGNITFKSSQNTAPHISEKGEPGDSATLDLELKLLADAGLVGFPNAGKSTLLSRLTKAHPKIADYPFTTLTPNLGVAVIGESSFVLADIPGLIEGAHEGKGLGDEFLRHVERTRVLVHLVDVGGTADQTPYALFRALNRELGAFSKSLLKKPQLVVATKMDLTGADKRLAEFKRRLKGVPVHEISAVTGEGLPRLLTAVMRALEKAPAEALYVPPVETRRVFEPNLRVENDGRVYRVRGRKVERLVKMTHFDQDESVARLQGIFRKMGVEKALEAEGAQPGDAVAIGDYEFSYRPEPHARR
jgi:GTP-binding protein